MQPDPATSAFLAFCRSGDGRQLGRAFDLVAPELLLVAAWLLPRHAAAPDLVQRTFLTARRPQRAAASCS